MRGEASATTLRHEFIGLYGMVERNWYLIKRYAWWEIAFFFWTAANTLTIVFIAKGVVADGGSVNIDRLTTILLIGAVMWSYLGIIFELLIETVAWERWEGTIEYTFMAPLTRAVHLLGTGIFAIGYGIVRASIVFAAIAAFFGLHMPNANFAAALVLIAVASISFVGIGMMTAVLPLISPEKGTQFGYVAQGLMLVVSGVYYPVSVLPEFMQWLAKISPATYALEGARRAIQGGASMSELWSDIWPLLLIGAVSIPLGLWVEGGVEDGDLRHLLAEQIRGRVDALEVRRVVQRRQVNALLKPDQHFLVDQDRPRETFRAVDHAVSNRVNVRQAGNARDPGFRRGNPVDDVRERRLVVAQRGSVLQRRVIVHLEADDRFAADSFDQALRKLPVGVGCDAIGVRLDDLELEG
jgi:ABC-2 type transport system permease protein